MISTTTNRVAYQGDGSSAVFNFGYEFHAQADLDVLIYNSSRRPEIAVQALNTNYTINGVQDAQARYLNGANVIFNSTPAVGDHIVLVRDMSPTNPFRLQFGQVIPNEEVTKTFDRLTLIEQRINDLSTRSVRLQDAYPFSFDPKLPAQLLKNAPVIINSSGQAMDVGVVAFNGTTAATYFGILPVPNGGTGIDFSILQGLIYSPGGGSTVFDRVLNGGPGLVLTGNGSSAPSFQPIGVVSINSGILLVDFGGTGTGTSYIQYGVVFASSATQMANTAAGGIDVPLIGNDGAAPSFRALNISSNSTVTGIMRQIFGGTGTASSFPQYAVIYQSGANSYGAISSGPEGNVLTSHGSSAPSFDVSAPTPIAPVILTSGTSVSTSQTTIILNSSNYNVTLYDPVLNAGREVTFLRGISTFGSPTTIVAPAGTGIRRGSVLASTFVVYTVGELTRVFADGTNWLVKDHFAETDPEPYTPSTIQGYGSSTFNVRRWRSGAFMHVSGRITAGTVAASEGRIGYTIVGETLVGTSIVTLEGVGDFYRTNSGAGTIYLLAEPGVGYFTVGIQSAGNGALTKVNASSTVSNSELFGVEGKVRIAGWNP